MDRVKGAIHRAKKEINGLGSDRKKNHPGSFETQTLSMQPSTQGFASSGAQSAYNSDRAARQGQSNTPISDFMSRSQHGNGDPSLYTSYTPGSSHLPKPLQIRKQPGSGSRSQPTATPPWDAESFPSNLRASAGSNNETISELPTTNPRRGSRDVRSDFKESAPRGINGISYPGNLPSQSHRKTKHSKRHEDFEQTTPTSSSVDIYELPTDSSPRKGRLKKKSSRHEERMAPKRGKDKKGRNNDRDMRGRMESESESASEWEASGVEVSAEETMIDRDLKAGMEDVMKELEEILTKPDSEKKDDALHTRFAEIREGFRQYNKLMAAAEENRLRWRSSRAKYRSDLATQSDAIKKLNIEISDLIKEKLNVETQKVEQDRRVSGMETYIYELQGKVKDLDGRITRGNRRYDELREERDTLDEQLQDAKRKHDSALRQAKEQARQDWIDQIEVVKNNLIKHIREAKEEHNRDKREWNETEQSYKEGIEELQVKIESLESEHKAEKRRMNAEFRDEKERMLSNFQKEKSQVKIRYQIKNEKLKAAGVNREHVKGLADPELATIFEDIDIKINSISLAEWNHTTQDDWPATQFTLEQLSGGGTVTSVIKEQIVQSYIWFILYHRIFATPYEVLGDEGVAKLEEWTGKFGTDKYSKASSRWPEPTEASEKQRWETVTQCIEAIQQGTDRKLKESFDQSVAATVDEISQTLKRVMSLDQRQHKKLHALVTDAANNWLKICSQRYRILVVLPYTKVNFFKSKKREPSSIRLVKKPEVRRIGNSNGKELGKQEAIANWEGEEVVYPE